MLDRLPSISVEAGVALLGLDTALLRRRLRGWRDDLRRLGSEVAVDDLSQTVFGAAFCVVEGVALLLRFLTHGDAGDLEAARIHFQNAVNAREASDDRDSRWVASHLRFLADEMEKGSLWSLLPPDVSPAARQAFTVTPPSVLTLWEPQRVLLVPDSTQTEEDLVSNGLDSRLRRLVISLPTSAGKTLFGELLMVTHLARSDSAVCYVTPLRSLGREVRRNLRRRLRTMAREVSNEAPDFGVSPLGTVADLLRALGVAPELLGAQANTQPDVEVMTPERLSHALRDDPEGVLTRFGMFIFDEAHLLAERGRGFLMESLLSFLHWRTRDSHHRIVLLSAALGNAAHVLGWLDVNGASRVVESTWRGPRRLFAIFNTDIRWSAGPASIETVAASGASSHLVRRLRYDAYGVVRLRPAENQPLSASTTSPVGSIAFRARADLTREGGPEGGHSTPFYRMLAHIVRYVAHGGPVLVIRSTRREAVQMAQAIAEELQPAPKSRAIAQLARIRLGADHPLRAKGGGDG